MVWCRSGIGLSSRNRELAMEDASRCSEIQGFIWPFRQGLRSLFRSAIGEF